MTTLLWILGILLALVAVANVVLSLWLQQFKRGGVVKQMSVDGVAFTTWWHYDSPLAHRLKTEGLAMDGHGFMHWPLASSSRRRVAHEGVHLVRWFLRCQQFGDLLGTMLYRLENAGQYLTQWRHDRRGGEEEAERGEGPLSEHPEGASIVVRGKHRLVTALFLAEVPHP